MNTCPPKKRTRGQPPHQPTEVTRAQVGSLAGCGMPQALIAGEIGVSKKTLLRHYRAELDSGLERANAKVAQSLFKRATNPDDKGGVTAAIFWLKCRAGWREAQEVHHTVTAGVDTTEALIERILGKPVSADEANDAPEDKALN